MKLRALLTTLTILGLAIGPALAGPETGSQANAQDLPDLPKYTSYQFVMLHLGPGWDRAVDPRTYEEFSPHGAYVGQLARDGKLVMGGPFLVSTDPIELSGAVFVMKTADPEQARKLAAADPMVRSGRLVIGEIRTFWFAVGEPNE